MTAKDEMTRKEQIDFAREWERIRAQVALGLGGRDVKIVGEFKDVYGQEWRATWKEAQKGTSK